MSQFDPSQQQQNWQQQPQQFPQQPQYPPQQQQWQQPPMQPFPSQQPPKKRHIGRNVGIGCGSIIALIVLIFVIVAASSHGSTTTTTPSDSSQSTQAVPAANSIGQVVTADPWTITVNSVTTSQGDQVFSPKSGNKYLVIDVTLNNTSSSSQAVSSLVSFVLKDSTGQSYNEALTDIGKPPDGTVQAGDKLRGELVYEVPASQHSFTFQFQSALVNGNVVSWTLNTK